MANNPSKPKRQDAPLRGSKSIRSPLPAVVKAYQTRSGEMFQGRIEDALVSTDFRKLRGKINLIVTSPPFPLVRKKKYGNETGVAYLEWLASLAKPLGDLLTEKGSIVIEIGNAWEVGVPVMSTLPLEALLEFKKAGAFFLSQHLICHNPARLPSPAAWVTVQRTRLKDSFTHVWWMSRSENPKANNRAVLTPYGADMKRLLRNQKYNAGVRPSGHVISAAGFLKDHGGSIPANVLDFEPDAALPGSLLKFSGTKWDADYRDHCKRLGISAHPARMQAMLSAFMIEFLSEPNDVIFDPFAGSNTTGAVAESLGRKWIGVEASAEYVEGSRGRFPSLANSSIVPAS